MSTLGPTLSATDGWMNILLSIVLLVVFVIILGAYPFTKWLAKRKKSEYHEKKKE